MLGRCKNKKGNNINIAQREYWNLCNRFHSIGCFRHLLGEVKKCGIIAPERDYPTSTWRYFIAANFVYVYALRITSVAVDTRTTVSFSSVSSSVKLSFSKCVLFIVFSNRATLVSPFFLCCGCHFLPHTSPCTIHYLTWKLLIFQQRILWWEPSSYPHDLKLSHKEADIRLDVLILQEIHPTFISRYLAFVTDSSE